MADEPVDMATSESLKFECGICLKEFSTSWCLQIHIKTHDEKKSFDCNECGKVFPNFNLLCDHLKEHIFGADPVEDVESCSVCAKQYPASQMAMHKRTHIFKPGLTCKKCGKSFGSSKVLKLHERTHDKNTPFQCSSCELKFASRNAFMLHWNNHCSSQPGVIHSKTLDNKRRSIETPQKAPTVRTEKGNVRSLKAGHCTRDIIKKGKGYKCNVCGKRFDCRSRAVMHYQVYHTEQTCFRKNSDSVRHMNDQVTESTVDKRSAEMDKNVKASDLIIEDGSSFMCTVCKKSFDSKQKACVHTLCHRRKREGEHKSVGLNHLEETDGHSGLSVERFQSNKGNKLQKHHVKSKRRAEPKSKIRKSGDSAVKYTCSECMTTFSCSQELKRHQSVHIREHAVALMRILDPNKDITLSLLNTKALAEAVQLATEDSNVKENNSSEDGENRTRKVDSGSVSVKSYSDKSSNVSPADSLTKIHALASGDDVISSSDLGAVPSDSRHVVTNIYEDSVSDGGAADDIDFEPIPDEISSYKSSKLALNHKKLSDECGLAVMNEQNKERQRSKEHDQPNKTKCRTMDMGADVTSNCVTKNILRETHNSAVPTLGSKLELLEKMSPEKGDLGQSSVKDEKVTPVKEHFEPRVFSNYQGPKRTRLDVYDKIILKHGKYHCALCSKVFIDQTKARAHVRNHVEAKIFKCDECGLALARRHAFELHKKMHERRRSSGLPPLLKQYTTVQQFGVDLNLTKEDCSPVMESMNPSRLAPDRKEMVLSEQEPEDHQSAEHTLSSTSDAFPLLNFRRKRMDIHGNILRKDGSSKCKICKREFSTYLKAYNHVRNHVAKKKFKCDECGLEMKSRNHYSLHKQRHELRRLNGIKQRRPVKSWSCDIQTVRENRILDNGHFICKICRKMSVDLCGLDSHIRRHFKKFKCLQCEKIFDKKMDLEEHEVLHKLKAEEETQRLLEQFPGVQRNVVVVLERLEDAKFAENSDIWTFVSRAECQIPTAEKDSNVDKSEVKCPDGGVTKCQNQQAWSLKPSWNKKAETDSTSGNGSLKKRPEDFHCHVCNKVFKQSNIFSVDEHIDNHFNIFECHLCCLSFSTKGYLLQHMGKTDHGETRLSFTDGNDKGILEEKTLFFYNNVELLGRSYLCKICGQNFTNKQIVKDHVMSHFKKGTSKCADPQLHLSRNNHSDDVSRLIEHSGNKINQGNPDIPQENRQPVSKQGSVFEHISKSGDDYLCNICQCLYTSKEKVKKHIRNHLHGSKFKCRTCLQSFKYKTNLELHQRLHGQTGIELAFGNHPQATEQRENGETEETFPRRGNHDPVGQCGEFTSMLDVSVEEYVERKGEVFCCTICARKFESYSEVSVHLKTHSTENKTAVSDLGLGAGETYKYFPQSRDETKDDQSPKILEEVQSGIPVQGVENNPRFIHSGSRGTSDDEASEDFDLETRMDNKFQTTQSEDAALSTKYSEDAEKLETSDQAMKVCSVDPIVESCDGSPDTESVNLNAENLASDRSTGKKDSSFSTEERSLGSDKNCDIPPSNYSDRNVPESLQKSERVTVDTTADICTHKDRLVGSTVTSDKSSKSDKYLTKTEQCNDILPKKSNATLSDFSDSDSDDASKNTPTKAVAAALAVVKSSEDGTVDIPHKSVVNCVTASTCLPKNQDRETLSASGLEDADDDCMLDDSYDDDRDSDYKCESDSDSDSDLFADDSIGKKTCTTSSSDIVVQQQGREIKVGKETEHQIAALNNPTHSKYPPVQKGETTNFKMKKMKSFSLPVKSSKESIISCTETGKVETDDGNSMDAFNDDEKQQDALPDSFSVDESGHFRCNYCVEVSESVDDIRKHIHSQHKIKKFWCKFCIATFHTDKERQQHYACNEHLEQRSQTRQVINENCHKVGDMYQCKLCGKEFAGRRNCENHIRYHLTSHNHTCDACGLSFRSQNALSIHQYTHLKFRPFTCNICSKAFPQKPALRQHEKSHSEQERIELLGYLKCETCSEICSSKKIFDRHVLKHKKSHTCEVCGVTFETTTGLENHQYEQTHYKCSQCEKTFKSANSFRRHVRDHDDKEVYPCELCGKICNNRVALISHLQIHKTKGRNKCEICGMTSSNRSWLKNHMKAHNDGGNRCDKCKKFCRTATSLKIHDMMHKAVEAAGETLVDKGLLKIDKHTEYTCPICESIVTSYDQLRYHIRHHFAEKKYKCDICSAAFHSSTYLKSHIKKHNNDLPFQCEQCPRKFPSKTLLNIHVKTLHLKLYNDKFECDICHKVLKKGHLKKHKLIHEKKRDRNYPCDECEFRFYTASDLKNHKQLHMAKYDFICETCGAQYKNKYSLRDHMLRHTGKKEFKCEECGKEFLLKGYLMTHLKNHRNERNFKCSECGKTFNHRNSLNDHMRIHTGEKPYGCKYCDRKFTDRSARGSHQRTHQGF